jgi:hypothetical protein
MLAQAAQFRPTLVLVDGLEHGAELSGLARVAAELQLPVWATLRNPDASVSAEVRAIAGVVLHLEPVGRNIQLELTTDGETLTLPVQLDCATLLAARTNAEPSLPPSYVGPGDCTLFSGGATGAEEAFGQAAERWGMREVAFTFEGHKQARSRGQHPLSARELAAGDVSLKYVSARLKRTYANETGLIKRVLQTIWHMVSRSQQVFVIGQIQPDGTVVGGTGWAVELARMWTRELWVFDQDRVAWFRWDGAEWTPGTPRIVARYLCGTGTRYLTDDGRAAIDALFDRSFGADPG